MKRTISYSQYATYETCPYKWKLSYKENRRIFTQNIDSLFGTAMHETCQTILTKYYEYKGRQIVLDIDWNEFLLNRIVSLYKETKEKMSKELIKEGRFSSGSLNEYYLDGTKIIRDFIKFLPKFYKKRNAKLVGIELHLDTKIKGNLYFNGYLDNVMNFDGTTAIIDFKKTYRGWGNLQKKDELKRAQLQLYKYFYHKEFGTYLKDIVVYFIFLKQKVYASTDFNVSHISKLEPPHSERTIKTLLKKFDIFINKCYNEDGTFTDVDDYPKTPSQNNCKYCSFKKTEFCDAKKEK